MSRNGQVHTPGTYKKGLGSAVAALAILATAGCSGSGVYATTQVPAKPSSPPISGAAPATAPVSCGNPLASFAPAASMPTPGAMPSGTYMATIQKRGRLIAGVSADTLLLGARKPLPYDERSVAWSDTFQRALTRGAKNEP